MAFGQNIDLHLEGEKNCFDDTYCVTVAVQSTSGDLQLGTSSFLLTYDAAVMKYRSHTPLNFTEGSACGGDWLAQKVDGLSRSGEFELTMALAENGTSCPSVSENTPVEVALVCFDILKQGGVPAVRFETENTQFNTHLPDDGTTWVPVGNAAEIFAENQLTCDCPGEGAPCDDGNIYTVNDKYDLDCHCLGEELDSDEDGILDGIDACLDKNYEAENAELTDVLIRNNQPQFSGLAFVDYNSNNNDAVEFTVTVDEAGEHRMAFRYALESGSRPMELSVDGVILFDEFDFPASGAWADWDTVFHSMDFTVGEHKIKLRTNGANGPNLDLLIFSTCTDCALAGTPCDDGNLCTTDDVYGANCDCGGRFLDDDFDTVCNELDQCPEADDLLDLDGDGIPDGCDDCDNGLTGQSCDDGNPCTIDDVYDADCQCKGTPTDVDSDGDGVCDSYDICPGGDDNLDEDGDGIPDVCDECDNQLIGSPCDDNDPCTLLDMVQPDCGCKGIYFDFDGDGVCNALDACPGFDDKIDNDNDGIPDACDPNVSISPYMEVGMVSQVGEDWVNVQLTNQYESPVVVATVHLPDTDFDPAVSRVRNAENDRFELRIQMPGWNTDYKYDVYYFVVEEGTYTLDEHGVKMEAQKVMSTETGSKATGFSREAREYLQPYSQPVVLGQVMTYNDENWSVFWQSRDNTNSTPADSLRFAAGKHVAEDSLTTRADEQLGIIVFETGNFIWDGVKLATAVGEDIVEDGIGNDGFSYSLDLASTNRAVLSQAGIDGGDGAWPVLYGDTPFRPNSMIVAVDEDNISDTDRYHTDEQVAYVAFEFTAGFSLLATSTDNECHGGTAGAASAEPFGGLGPYSYEWSTGETTAVIENLTAGTYTVTVTDELGSELTTNVIIEEPSAIEVAAEGSEVDCFGNENGTANVFAEGGTGNFAFLWNTGSEEAVLENLAPGIYTVTATDANGCTATASATVESQSPLEVETESSDALCFGSATALASASSEGGSGAVNWLWSNGATTPTVDGLSAGMYTVSATDGNGCVAVASVEIGEPTELLVDVEGTDATCFGTATATVVATSNGGSSSVSWLWENGMTSPEVDGLSAGIYSVTATDANGCESIGEVEIIEPEELVVEAEVTEISCHGFEDGELSASFTGGNDGVTYLWSNGETGETIYNLPEGEYTVTATDANGCEATTTAQITEPEILSLSGNSENVNCFGEANGEASVEVSGGAGGMEYIWSDGQVGGVATDLLAGEYTVTATDANGCSLVGFFNITEPDLLIANATGTDISCFEGNDGVSMVTSLGGTGSVTFEWNNGASGPIVTSLASGVYTVTATDANSCTSTSSIEINQPATAVEIVVDNVLPGTYSNPDGSAAVTVSGGTGDMYSFEWILNGTVVSTEEDPTDLVPGEYTLNVTDENGCLATEIIVIESLTSAEERKLSDAISIQPNPTSGEFFVTIELPNPMELDVTVINAAGEQVQDVRSINGKRNSLGFDLSEQSSGVYLLKIKTDELALSKRIVVVR